MMNIDGASYKVDKMKLKINVYELQENLMGELYYEHVAVCGTPWQAAGMVHMLNSGAVVKYKRQIVWHEGPPRARL